VNGHKSVLDGFFTGSVICGDFPHKPLASKVMQFPERRQRILIARSE
jgi:hypothetical protein